MTDTAPVPVTVPATIPTKPGYQTTEFYGAWAAKIFGALLTSGLLADGSIAMRITGAAVFVLAQLGYTWSRTAVKTAVMLLLVGALAAPQMACGSTAKSVEKSALADVVDCTTPDRAKLEAQFGPTLEQAILRATGQDGKIDLPSLQQIGNGLDADGWCVLEKVAAGLIFGATTKNPSAPAAATAPLDAQDLAAQVARLRVKKFAATQFQFGAGRQSSIGPTLTAPTPDVLAMKNPMSSCGTFCTKNSDCFDSLRTACQRCNNHSVCGLQDP